MKMGMDDQAFGLLIERLKEIQTSQDELSKQVNDLRGELHERFGKVYKNLEPIKESLTSHDNRLSYIEKNTDVCKTECKGDISKLKGETLSLREEISLWLLIKKNPKMTLLIVLGLILLFRGEKIFEILRILPLK